MTMSQNVLVVDAPSVERGPPVWQKFLDVITTNSRRVTDYGAPYILTQDGMAEALGISRPHAAVAARQLVRMGEVEPRLSRVILPDGKQGPVRRYVYVPVEATTQKDEHDLRALAEYAYKLYGTQKCIRLADIITKVATKSHRRSR